MAAENGQPHEEYTVSCYFCTAEYNALEAAWCSCLGKQRTFVCPTCLSCFCSAPQPVKALFWSNAPQAMWKRRMEEKSVEWIPKAAPSPSEVTRPLVLVADDDRDIQKIAVTAVQSLGYSVILARDGMEALEMANKYKPELVLSDALMPKLDGRELCRRLKEAPDTEKIKVVVMTSAYTAGKYKAEAVKNFHVDDYLSKPVEFKLLRELLQKHLG